MKSDQSLKGVLLAFAAFAAYSWSDASVKLIEGALSPYQSACLGALFGLVGFPFLLKPGDRWSDALRTTNRPLWMLRFVSGLAPMPLMLCELLARNRVVAALALLLMLVPERKPEADEPEAGEFDAFAGGYPVPPPLSAEPAVESEYQGGRR